MARAIFRHAFHHIVARFWLRMCLSRLITGTPRCRALAAMMRFSRVGHLSVAAVFLSGALDVAMTSGSWPWPPVTPWRIGLFCKVAVFAAMTALALVNRYAFAPRLSSPRAAKALAAGAVAEIVLGLVALALVAGFATQDPNTV